MTTTPAAVIEAPPAEAEPITATVGDPAPKTEPATALSGEPAVETTPDPGKTVPPDGVTPAVEPAAEPTGPPQHYDLQVDEAFRDSGFGQTELDAFHKLARAQEMTNEQAQTVLDALPEQYSDQRQRFRSELEADPTLGKELPAVEQRARQAIEHYLPADKFPEDNARLKRDMTMTGYGNYKPLVQLLAQVGLELAEDRPNLAGQPAGQPAKTHAQHVWEGMNP